MEEKLESQSVQITYCKEKLFFLLYTIPKFHKEGKVSSMKSLSRGMFSDGVGTSRSAAECETPCYWTFIVQFQSLLLCRMSPTGISLLLFPL